MDHTRARELASARFDGELDRSPLPALEEHLASCASCRTFAARLERVAAFARAVPAERAPEGFASDVLRALPAARARVRRAWRLAPALAVVAAVAIVALVLRPLGPFTLPEAAAAEALTKIETFEIERVITTRDPLDPDEGPTRIEEHIWFAAPSSLRIERVTKGAEPHTETTIVLANQQYSVIDGVASARTGRAPTLDFIPEPLSASIVFLGTELGPGPVVAGRPTRRIRVDLPGGGYREALVDADRFTALGIEQRVVLGKVFVDAQRVHERKRTLSVSYNEPISSELFKIPFSTRVRPEFQVRPLTSLRIAPARAPEGLVLLRAGSGTNAQGQDREVILYGRGAFPILIEERDEVPEGTIAVEVGTGSGRYLPNLYGFPSLSFRARGTDITISAMLPPGALAELAAAMYPDAE